MNWKPMNCPRFDACNAPICPLDPDWPRSRHVPGEATCRYLSEMAKDDGSAARLGECDEAMRARLEAEHPKIIASVGATRRALQQAAKRPSKLGRRPGPVEG